MFELGRPAQPCWPGPGGAWVCAPSWETQSQQRKGRSPLRIPPSLVTLRPRGIGASLAAVKAGVKVRPGASRGMQSSGHCLLKADGALCLLHSLHGCLLSARMPGPALHHVQGQQTLLRRNGGVSSSSWGSSTHYLCPSAPPESVLSGSFHGCENCSEEGK